jgi:outer membrane protein TolC
MRITRALALVLILSSSARGQELRANLANPDSALNTILAGIEGTRLPLGEAVRSALTNATSVRTAEAMYLSASGTALREVGAYDPTLFLSFNRSVEEQPTASFFSGASVLNITQNSTVGGVRLDLPTGTSLEASINALSLWTNSAFANLNPQYTTAGMLSLRQPLLSGFTVSGNKFVVKADREADAAKAGYDQEVLAIATRVEEVYWDLYAAERDFAVQKLTRDRAEAFLRDTETRAKSGLIGPNQVANARTFLAEQEILLLDREELLDRISDGLSSTIGRRPDVGHTRLVTVDRPPDDFPIEDVETLVALAQSSNLSVQAARADVQAQRALSRAAAWEKLPSLDLVASLGGNGLAGTPRDVIFNTDTLRTSRGGTMRDALSQSLKRQYPTWSVGVEFSFPILLRAGRGEQERLDAEVIIAEQRLVQISRILDEEVRASCREVFNGSRRLRAALEGVAAAQEQVRIGLVEFQNGRSTAFELVRLGEDFAVAQQRYSQALVRSAKAAARLRQLTSGAYKVPGK